MVDWVRTYGESGNDKAFSVLENSEGDYVVSGYSTSFGGGREVFNFKVDPSGGPIWARTYGGSGSDGADEIYGTLDIAEVFGGYAATAYTESYGAGAQDFYLIKTDESGYSSCGDIDVSPLVVSSPVHTVSNQAPATTSGGTSTNASAVIGNETDEEVIECSGVGIEESQFEINISIYPNPTNGELFVDLSDINGIEIEFSIANSLGEIVFKSAALAGEIHPIDIHLWSKGMYLICVTSDGRPIFRDRFVR